MKTIIAGSRDITDYNLLKQAILEAPFKVSIVISGYARGVDMLGVKYASDNNLPLMIMKANWDRDAKSAGYIRNSKMADLGEALIAITNGSKGTEHMINTANKKGLKVFVKRI